ncbi:hypothetical protein NECAME_05517, partial [Necator americanus]
MVEFALGDLYDEVAAKNIGAVINREESYECKYCPMFQNLEANYTIDPNMVENIWFQTVQFLEQQGERETHIASCRFNIIFVIGSQISGTSLCDSDSGRAHAAAHRIAFEALLEPSPVLVCPICDLPQKTSELACVFGCMFNDLDLVEHLEQEHGEVLRDEMVCDFSDPRYLFTTFRQKQTPSTPHAIDEANAVNDERNTIILCQDGRDVGSDASEPGVVTANRSKSVRGHETSLPQEGPAETTGFGNEHRNDGTQTNVNIGTNRIREHTEGRKREQMKGPSYSFIACLICDWSPLMFRDSHKMREEISSHVRSHIREEANKLPSRADNSITDQRLLSCMDFSLEEYFEKEHLTDLSGTINSRIMERVYSDLLTKLFGICVPVVYRILHGNNGNPFRPPDAARNRRKAKVSSKSKGN